MPGADDEKREPAKTPSGADQRATPHGTPEHSQPTSEFSLTDSSLRRLNERFELLAEVGRGGMGVVCRARDRETGEIVALKVLKPEIAARPEVIERFKTELRLARKITHKNVCRTHDLHRFGDTVVIAMEYVEGESLRAVLNRPGGVSLRGGLNWVSQICAALAEAHAQGVVHRDLKPENVMLDPAGQVKIMDFGIARSLETDATQTGAVLGTPAYMSPEQAQGKHTDARSDIYSLGLILYEMFTGRAAFKADTPVALAVKQIHDTAPPPREVEPDLPARIERAIEKCLEKNPNKRFQSVAELDAALAEKPEAKRAVIPGQEVELPVHLTRWQPSDWLLVVAAVAGLALYFPFFNRTSLAPRSKVSFDASVLRRIAQEYAQRLGAPTEGESRIETEVFPASYDFVAERAGARAALEMCNNPVPYWSWSVTWNNETQVRVNNRGSLEFIARSFPVGFAPDKLPFDEAKPIAEKALRDYFGREPSELILETASDSWIGRPAVAFIWADRDDFQGLKRHYRVWLVGREISNLNRVYFTPPGYAGRNIVPYWMILPWFGLNFVLMIVGILQRHSVDSGARWRLGIVALGFCVETWAAWRIFSPESPYPTSVVIILCFFLGLATALLAFFVLIAVERSVQRMAPAKLVSLVWLFTRAAASEPCALAILRGTLVGLALLGGETFLAWLSTKPSPLIAGRLDTYIHIFVPARFQIGLGPSSEVLCVLASMLLAAFIAITVGFFTSLMARLVRRPWPALLAAAALSVFFMPSLGMGAVQPYYWKALLLLFDSLLLGWTFTRFDVLTLVWAGFTFVFCWWNYQLLVMVTPGGVLEPWIAFAVWGLFVLAAGAMAFKVSLRAASRRVAAAFE